MIGSKKLTYFMSFFAIVEIILLCYSFIYFYVCMDHAEHLHASWLIWNGKVPYRDFFEHHNPLLWYILSPIVRIFYPSATILYVSRAISALAYFSVFGVIYKISRKFLNVSKVVIILSLLIFYSLPDSYYLLYELHPDTFMLLSYFLGLHYYFNYLEEKKQRDLNISFILFVISFLFLQKILVILFYTGIFTIYLIFTKKISIKPILIATITPVVIILVFITYFYLIGALSRYFTLNYELNFIMQKFLGNGRVLGDLVYSVYLPLLSLLTVKHFLKDGNIYKKMIVFIVIMEYITKHIVGAQYIQYFIFNNILSSIIIANYIVDNIVFKRSKLLLGIIILMSFCIFYKRPINNSFYNYYKMNKIIYSIVRKDDPLISSVHYINIYGKDVSYYWFGVGNISPVAYYFYNYDEPFLLNDAILKNKPKIIFNDRYTNKMIQTSLFNGVKIEDYIENLSKVYETLDVKVETEGEFVRRWILKEFLTIDKRILTYNYYTHPDFPIFIRKDIIDTNYRLK